MPFGCIATTHVAPHLLFHTALLRADVRSEAVACLRVDMVAKRRIAVLAHYDCIHFTLLVKYAVI